MPGNPGASPSVVAEAVSGNQNTRNVSLLIAAGVAIFVLAVTWYFWGQPDQRVLSQDTAWSSDTTPLVISQVVVVPSNVTLTVLAGTTVHFQRRAGLRVAGQLIVEGEEKRIVRLLRHPASFRPWAGISFADSLQDNRLRHAHIVGAGSEGSILRLHRSRLAIESVHFSGAPGGVISATDSSLVLRDSTIESVGGNEMIRATRIPVDGHFRVEDNVFWPVSHDVVDLEACRSPGATARFVGNVFLGGGDDGLDLDDCEAWVEGNVFVNFQARQSEHQSYAISCSVKSEVVVSNNLFVDNDSAVLSKQASHVRLLQNTIHGSRIAAISFDEQNRGAGGMTVVNCVFGKNRASFLHEERAILLSVSNSVLPEASRWPDLGNLAGEPAYRDEAAGDFRLQENSPVSGKGASVAPAKTRAALRKRGQGQTSRERLDSGT